MKNNASVLIIAVTTGILVLLGSVIVFSLLNLGAGNQSAGTANRGSPPASLQELLNKPAPSFSLTDLQGKVYTNETLRGKNVILFFNEGLMCYPACWNQMISLGDDARFKADGTLVFSVVVDQKDEWRRAIDKMADLGKVTALFDTDKAVSRSYGALNAPSSMHAGSMPGHTYVLLDKDGIVRFTLDDPRMGIHNDELAQMLGQLNTANL